MLSRCGEGPFGALTLFAQAPVSLVRQRGHDNSEAVVFGFGEGRGKRPLAPSMVAIGSVSLRACCPRRIRSSPTVR